VNVFSMYFLLNSASKTDFCSKNRVKKLTPTIHSHKKIKIAPWHYIGLSGRHIHRKSNRSGFGSRRGLRKKKNQSNALLPLLVDAIERMIKA
jgi:hypothetical protein